MLSGSPSASCSSQFSKISSLLWWGNVAWRLFTFFGHLHHLTIPGWSLQVPKEVFLTLKGLLATTQVGLKQQRLEKIVVRSKAMHLRRGYRSLLGKNKLYLPYSTFKCKLAVGMESQSLETFETRLDKASENILLKAILWCSLGDGPDTTRNRFSPSL